MQRYKILWVDDEIDLLKPYILYLEEKNYVVESFNNPFSLIEYIDNNNDYNLILIDENMPGKSGISLISDIKNKSSSVPIIMITKNEEENLMEEAIGSEISDYLLKPLNPNQLLISVKKVLENSVIIENKLKADYVNFFNELSSLIKSNENYLDWFETYKKITEWEINLDKSNDNQISEMLISQKKEANKKFSEFIINNYSKWGLENKNRPLMSNDLLKKKVFPHIKNEKIFFILIDNFRYDQWKILEKKISKYFFVKEEVPFLSILPTTTEYSRNSIFSGLTPFHMNRDESELWSDKSEGLNKNEFNFLDKNLQRNGINIKHSYNKIISYEDGINFLKNISKLKNYDFSSVVFNFIDMLSHSKTDSKVFRNLVYDEKSFRSFTASWFENSSFNELMKYLSSKDIKVFLTTDHGTIKVDKPVKIKASRDVNNNIRFKYGKNISSEEKKIFINENGEEIFLPKINIFNKYIFAIENQYLLYPTNYNYHLKNFNNTFQHGGISMEEMIIPFVELTPRNI